MDLNQITVKFLDLKDSNPDLAADFLNCHEAFLLTCNKSEIFEHAYPDTYSDFNIFANLTPDLQQLFREHEISSLRDFASRKKSERKFVVALLHATQLAQEEGVKAENLMFRCGPCDICGGDCLCQDDELLLVQTYDERKPLASFTFQCFSEMKSYEFDLKALEFTTWCGRNKMGMFIVLATMQPDRVLVHHDASVRELAFNYDFINELGSVDEMRDVYGYPDIGTVRRNSPFQNVKGRS